MDYRVICKSCGKVEVIKNVNEERLAAWQRDTSIQKALPELTVMQREVMITGLCQDCLSRIYNTPKDGEDWGETLGECICCGAALWERNRNSSGDVICPLCYANQSEEDCQP